MRSGSPVPIPNTEVKHFSADDSGFAKIGRCQYFFYAQNFKFLGIFLKYIVIIKKMCYTYYRIRKYYIWRENIMNKKFLLVDKINNIQREATCILTFQNNNEDYLIYYLDENNNNKQIFVSKLTRNTEGKYFISDVKSNDKNRINNIVYNIVIVLPSDKNTDKESLVKDFENKYGIKFIFEPFEIENQTYLNSSRVAITSGILVNNCINFYYNNLNSDNTNQIEVKNNIEIKTTDNLNLPIVNGESMQLNNNLEIPTLPIIDNNTLDNANLTSNSNDIPQANNNSNNELPNINPQMQIIENIENNVPVQTALNNDISIVKNNVDNSNKKDDGFVINTAIVVGTVALILAVLIVTITFIAIKKMII